MQSMNEDNVICVDFRRGSRAKPANWGDAPPLRPLVGVPEVAAMRHPVAATDSRFPGASGESRPAVPGEEADPTERLYTRQEVARIIQVPVTRLQSWQRGDLIAPSHRRGRSPRYSFEDLVALKTVKGLTDAGVPLRSVKAACRHLRRSLPTVERPLAQLRIVADGSRLRVFDRHGVYEPATGQGVFDFRVDTLVADVHSIFAMARAADEDAQPARSPSVPCPNNTAFHRGEDERNRATATKACTNSNAWRTSANNAGRGRTLDTTPTLGTSRGKDRTEVATAATRHCVEEADIPSGLAGRPFADALRAYLEGCRLDCRSDSDLHAAADAYRQALELDPSLACAWTNLGNLHYRQGNLGQAERCYREAAQTDGQQPEAYYNLGYLALEAGHWSQAALQLEKAVKLDPAFADAHYNLAYAYARLDRVVEASEHWRRYLVFDPKGVWSQAAQRAIAALSG